ncbi:LytR/AlgR family response regulator transcription factor [Foetidibacter luteolus]|uniref:LytR/AlgR family response regulator transcription factor n=1 Tax=Foetidibacter luteolus TaxID=2608880 RepID=UPI00129B5CA9|nr:LytTR family DNA-binding domain-containing protein [Foetidibacter luteolus]
MKVLIIEDERPALENMMECLRNADEQVKIIGTLSSVQNSINWLNANPLPDLIFMDIQLSDGLSFNILKQSNITCPVIFTTAFDHYITQALDYNSIDYLLKPIDCSRINNTIKKYKNLQQHFVNNYSTLLDYLNHQQKKRSRVVVKKGLEFQTIRLEDIAYFFTEHKVVFVVDKDCKKFLAEIDTLAELEEELDDSIFFRANRKYIVNANYINRYKSVDKSKISLELSVPVNEEIIISQENASTFKKWISEI